MVVRGLVAERGFVVVRGVVQINGSAREASDGTGLGKKAVLGACASPVDEVAWGPKPLAVCLAVLEGLAGAIDHFTVGGMEGLLLAGMFSCGIVGQERKVCSWLGCTLALTLSVSWQLRPLVWYRLASLTMMRLTAC